MCYAPIVQRADAARQMKFLRRADLTQILVELNGKIKLAESLIKQIFLPQINNQIPVIDENTIYNSL